MTEAEWKVCRHPMPMLDHLRDDGGARKRRLFTIACCKRIEGLLIHPVSRAAVEVGERFADGLVSDDQRQRAYQEADAVRCALSERGSELIVPHTALKLGGAGSPPTEHTTRSLDPAVRDELDALLEAAGIDCDTATAAAGEAWHAAEPGGRLALSLGGYAVEAVDQLAGVETAWEEQAAQAALLRDIFGNPFHPVAFLPQWRTDTAVSLARQMYDAREFSAMPILADALQDAGCDSDDILDHCRGEGPHVRGCWVCDLVLGKG